MNPSHGDLVSYPVSFNANPNLHTLGVKFNSRLTLEYHVCGIVSCVIERICIMRLVKCVFLDVFVLLCCYYAFVLPIVEYYYPVWGPLLNVTFGFFSARCIRWPGVAPIRVSRRCVIDVMLLHCVCRTSCVCIIQTRISVFSVSVHLLLPELDILESWPQLIHWSLNYQDVYVPIFKVFPTGPDPHVERPSLHCVRHRNVVCKGEVNRSLLP